MSKICTDLEQSRKLLSLGIKKNTADMHYFSDGYNPTKLDVGYSAENAKFYRGTKNEYIPAWSLTALLKLMPKIKAATPILVNALLEEKYYCHYQGIGTYKEVNTTSFQDEPVDAAFEMVCWLLENGYIKKVKK